MNFLKQSQAAFFYKYGYIHLQNQLPYHMKFKLLNSNEFIMTILLDNFKKYDKFPINVSIFNFELL